MEESVGQCLKRERELRGVSIEEVAAATRISGRFLSAIEADQWEELPTGIFVRGFIRAYADYLGLDAEGVLLHAREQQDRLATRTLVGGAMVYDDPALVTASGGWRNSFLIMGPRRRLLMGGLAMAALLLLAWLFFWRHRPRAAPAPGKTPDSAPVVTAPAPALADPAAGAVTMEIMARPEERRVYLRLNVDGALRFQGDLTRNMKLTESGRIFELYSPSAGGLQLRVEGKLLDSPGRRGEVLAGWRYIAGQGVQPYAATPPGTTPPTAPAVSAPGKAPAGTAATPSPPANP